MTVTLQELETYWSINDLEDALEMMQWKAARVAEAKRLAEENAARGQR